MKIVPRVLLPAALVAGVALITVGVALLLSFGAALIVLGVLLVVGVIEASR